MDPLRSALVRLAHTHPQFRKDLLPLLKQAGPYRPTPAEDILAAVEGVLSRRGGRAQLLRGEVRGTYVARNLDADHPNYIQTMPVEVASVKRQLQEALSPHRDHYDQIRVEAGVRAAVLEVWVTLNPSALERKSDAHLPYNEVMAWTQVQSTFESRANATNSLPIAIQGISREYRTLYGDVLAEMVRAGKLTPDQAAQFQPLLRQKVREYMVERLQREAADYRHG